MNVMKMKALALVRRSGDDFRFRVCVVARQVRGRDDARTTHCSPYLALMLPRSDDCEDHPRVLMPALRPGA